MDGRSGDDRQRRRTRRPPAHEPMYDTPAARSAASGFGTFPNATYVPENDGDRPTDNYGYDQQELQPTRNEVACLGQDLYWAIANSLDHDGNGGHLAPTRQSDHNTADERSSTQPSSLFGNLSNLWSPTRGDAHDEGTQHLYPPESHQEHGPLPPYICTPAEVVDSIEYDNGPWSSMNPRYNALSAEIAPHAHQAATVTMLSDAYEPLRDDVDHLLLIPTTTPASYPSNIGRPMAIEEARNMSGAWGESDVPQFTYSVSEAGPNTYAPDPEGVVSHQNHPESSSR